MQCLAHIMLSVSEDVNGSICHNEVLHHLDLECLAILCRTFVTNLSAKRATCLVHVVTMLCDFTYLCAVCDLFSCLNAA